MTSWKLGSSADNARFISERANALSPEEGLSILEDLRAMTYEDPEAPPRLERVFVLSQRPSRAREKTKATSKTKAKTRTPDGKTRAATRRSKPTK